MRCLFCKDDSSNTKSIEHIIPESLGNKTMILPRGYVCDKCNNYFAIKVEKPFMELAEIRQLRFQEMIPNKKNRMPQTETLYDGIYPVKLGWDVSDKDYMGYIDATDEVIDRIINNGKGYLVFPAFTNETIIKNCSTISRLLAKIALESLAYKLKNLSGSLDEIIDSKEYDPIRNHARRGTTFEWPCSIRRIYGIDTLQRQGDDTWEQIIHESDFLMIDIGGKGEIRYIILYFVLVLWGMEFAINMAEPEIEVYNHWLDQHNRVSPLYAEKKVYFI